MKKNKIKLTEAQLHNIIKESVKTILIQEGSFFDKFRRTYSPHSILGKLDQEGLLGCIKYDKKTRSYFYEDRYGNTYPTKIGFDKSDIGRNWNIFGSTRTGGGIAASDFGRVRRLLQNWIDSNARDIDRNAKFQRDRQRQARAEELRSQKAIDDWEREIEINQWERDRNTRIEADRAARNRAWEEQEKKRKKAEQDARNRVAQWGEGLWNER